MDLLLGFGEDGSPPKGQRSQSAFNNVINLSKKNISISQPSSNIHQSDPVKRVRKNGAVSKNRRVAGGDPQTPTGTPLGPAPKTVSILSALNELSISEEKGGRRGKRESWIPVPEPGRLVENGKEEIKCSKAKSVEEWIRKIFRVAELGRLRELRNALQGMDPSLSRYLVDSEGRNLLHVAAERGYLFIMQWLISILGDSANAALNDQDKEGRTPILAALQNQQNHCFQWLVLHTEPGSSALFPPNGERTLLHHASRFGNVAAVRWTAQLYIRNNVSVDVKTNSGATPLCDAAQVGDVSVCHELIVAGADPLYQTGIGWKPVDFAIRNRALECVNYLTMAELAACVGKELYSWQKGFFTLEKAQEALCTHFRELLRVGKWLVKERTDLIKSLSFSKSSEVSALLLGDSGSGTRFSDLEVTLVKAEQALKEMGKTPMKSRPGCSSDKPFNLQDVLVAAQARCESLMSPPNSTSPGETPRPSHTHVPPGEEEDEEGVSINSPDLKIQQESEEERIRMSKPWLLLPASGSTILSQLSPLEDHHVDILEDPVDSSAHLHKALIPSSVPVLRPAGLLNPSPDNMPYNNSLGLGSYGSIGSEENDCFYAPTSVNVIEPHLMAIKEPHPDRISEETGSKSPWLQQDSIYSEIREEEVGEETSQPRLPSPEMCQNHQLLCDRTVHTEDSVFPPHSSSEKPIERNCVSSGVGGERSQMIHSAKTSSTSLRFHFPETEAFGGSREDADISSHTSTSPPSETESALAPSNASSQASKTESAQDDPHQEPPNFEDNQPQSVPHKQMAAEDFSLQITKVSGGMRQLPGGHKGIHRHGKGGRRKAWYEIEGSSDEDEHQHPTNNGPFLKNMSGTPPPSTPLQTKETSCESAPSLHSHFPTKIGK